MHAASLAVSPRDTAWKRCRESLRLARKWTKHIHTTIHRLWITAGEVGWRRASCWLLSSVPRQLGGEDRRAEGSKPRAAQVKRLSTPSRLVRRLRRRGEAPWTSSCASAVAVRFDRSAAWNVPFPPPEIRPLSHACALCAGVRWWPASDPFRLWRRREAHVPTESPPSGQDPRLPSPHAHARRAVDLVVAAPQGPRPPGRIVGGGTRPDALERRVQCHRASRPTGRYVNSGAALAGGCERRRTCESGVRGEQSRRQLGH